MKYSTYSRLTAIIGTGLLALALVGCGGGSGDPPAPAPATIGASGGTVAGPGGAQVVVPPGALAQNVAITIAQTDAGAPPLPPGVASAGPIFAFTPHGTTFATPVTITVPFDPAAVPAGGQLALFKTNAALTAFEEVAGATVNGNTMTAQVTGFSFLGTGLRPNVEQLVLKREWQFFKFDKFGELSAFTNPRTQTGGEVADTFDFGPLPLTFEVDGGRSPTRATGAVFSSADGITYSAFAEGPLEQAGKTKLIQQQSFVKRKDDASLQIVITKAFLKALDFNNRPSTAECPEIPDASSPQRDFLGFLCPLMEAEITFNATAYKGGTIGGDTLVGVFFATGGKATLQGFDGNWEFGAHPSGLLTTAGFWSKGNFVEIGKRSSAVEATLIGPLVLNVDLSTVGLCAADEKKEDCRDRAFTLRSEVVVQALNGRAREAGIAAFLQDPLDLGGAEFRMTGLEATDEPLPPPPAARVEPPLPCTAPNVAAGVLQFSAGSYSLGERPFGGEPILVTRTGGSQGAVSVTFRAIDATGVAGVDYDAPATTVRFADGDTEPRFVDFTVRTNNVAAPAKTVDLQLSEPGGCATLGALASAVLTIRDDDAPPPPSAFSIGGTVTGLAGSGLVLTNGGLDLAITGNGTFVFALPVADGVPYNVAVRTQPTGPSQVCTIARGSGTIAGASVTDIGVDCATPPPNSTLDLSFGAGGKVTAAGTGIASAVALQADGRIVSAGGPFTLTRHNGDGSPDASFGVAGKVTTTFNGGAGTANDVAVQGDGRIVVAGSTRARAGFPGDDNFGVHRFNGDGSLDASFGAGGIVSTDFSGLADAAKAVAIQPDGKIVVAGQTQGSLGTDLAVVRYNSDGSLDASFGNGGKVITDVAGGVDFASALALQPDGRIVVLARVSRAGSNVVGIPALVRYDTSGAADGSFGLGGKVVGATSGPADHMALQADGKILVAGSVDAGSSNSAFGLTRFLANGASDAAFGTPTARFFTGGNGSIGRAVAVLADGRIVVVGEAASGASSTFDVAVALFDVNGTLDPLFDTDGKLTVDYFGGIDAGLDVVIQPDGKVVVAGSARNGTATEFALMRVNP